MLFIQSFEVSVEETNARYVASSLAGSAAGIQVLIQLHHSSVGFLASAKSSELNEFERPAPTGLRIGDLRYSFGGVSAS